MYFKNDSLKIRYLNYLFKIKIMAAVWLKILTTLREREGGKERRRKRKILSLLLFASGYDTIP